VLVTGAGPLAIDTDPPLDEPPHPPATKRLSTSSGTVGRIVRTLRPPPAGKRSLYRVDGGGQAGRDARRLQRRLQIAGLLFDL
jgi:hypothetical protein